MKFVFNTRVPITARCVQAHAPEVAGLQLEKYVAGAVVVYNMQSGGVERWRTHLDLSTDTTAFRAYMYSSPTVADLDGDGNLEIIVGTSMVGDDGLLGC